MKLDTQRDLESLRLRQTAAETKAASSQQDMIQAMVGQTLKQLHLAAPADGANSQMAAEGS